MELRTELKSIQGRIQAIRETIKNRINSLPDNPKIKRIAPKCFVVMSSEVFKHQNWTPEFHDFKIQYKAVLTYLEGIRDIKNFIPRLETVLERGYITKKQHNYNTIKIQLHPDVVKHIQQIIL